MKLFVFDLDGTLVDSRRDLADSANEVLAWAGAPTLPEAVIARMVGDGAAVLVARAFSATGREQPPGALQKFLDVYGSRLLRFTRPYEGVCEALEVLHDAGSGLALLTNKPLVASRQILVGLDLIRFFPEDRIQGGDGPLPRKPDPAGLRRLMSNAGATPGETLMIGDSHVDWRTARAAGARVCLVRWGFGFESVALHELHGDDVVIDTPPQLLSLL